MTLLTKLYKAIETDKQADVWPLYAEAIQEYSDLTRHSHIWLGINQAIIDRWSISGLKRIKTEAWKIANKKLPLDKQSKIV